MFDGKGQVCPSCIKTLRRHTWQRGEWYLVGLRVGMGRERNTCRCRCTIVRNYGQETQFHVQSFASTVMIYSIIIILPSFD